MATTATDPMEDPLDPRRIVVDMVDLLSHEVLVDSKYREERARQLNYFLGRMGESADFGRIYCRLATASMVEKFCGRDAYRRKSWPTEDGQDQKEKETTGHITPLVEYTVDQWEEHIEELKDLRAVYIRMDANTLVVPLKVKEYPIMDECDSDDDDEKVDLWLESMEDPSVNEELASGNLFQKKYDELIINFRFHQALSIFRVELERELDQADEVDIETPSIQPNDLAKFDDFLSTHFESENNKGARNLLESLLVRGKGGDRSTRCSGLALKSIGQLNKTFSRKEFSLDRLQKKVEKILLKWSEAVLDRPTLAELGYGRSVLPPVLDDALPAAEDEEQLPGAKRPRVAHDQDEEAGDIPDSRQQLKGKSKRSKKKGKENEDPANVPEEVQELSRARQTLRDDVDDPLDESRAIAATAARPPAVASQRSPRDAKSSAKKVQAKKGADFYNKKPSARNLIFTDSEDESDDDEGGTTLSAVPLRPNIRTAEEKPRRAERLPSPTVGASRKRKRWTDEEKSAIKLGVERFGFGRWAKIKEYYSEELRSRTSVNIKDAYRTMMKNNEV